MEPTRTLTETPDDAAMEVISSGLTEFNEGGAGRPSEYRPLAIVVSDPETGEALGGLWAGTSFAHLHIHLLYLPESLRGNGLGRKIVQQAEDEAIGRGCSGAWLDTFSFQARGFYERLGYTVFGILEEYPPGHSRFFLKKRLENGEPQPA